MILVYTGDGKGKTSACIGQAVRALGQNLAVAFGQFMKRDGQAGEQAMLAQWLGPRFMAGGPGFLRREEDRPAHREAALRVLQWAQKQLENVDLLVLDETLYALKAGVLTREEVEELIALARARAAFGPLRPQRPGLAGGYGRSGHFHDRNQTPLAHRRHCRGRN